MAVKKVKLTTTLDLLRANNACVSGLTTVIKHLPEEWENDRPINLLRILKSNGVSHCLWALRACQQDPVIVRKTLVRIACATAERALKHFERKYPDDKRPRDCIKATRGFMLGKVPREELVTARRAAVAADAGAAYAAAYAAADGAAYAAYAAAYAAAAGAAYAADAAAAYADAAAAYAADAAYAAAYAAAAAARKEEEKRQEEIIKKYLA